MVAGSGKKKAAHATAATKQRAERKEPEREPHPPRSHLQELAPPNSKPAAVP